ncbi:MAG: hypothetical protein H5T24_08825 [Bacteroidales bacterium]|nr:hypothetical protein [Bacteroidales bacterium]
MSRITETVPEIRMVDFEMGQLDALAADQRPSVVFPCCLIDIDYVECEDESTTEQTVTARVTLKVAFEQQLPTDSLSPDAKRSAALTVFDTMEQLHAAIQGFSTSEFSAFSRVSMSPDRRFVGIRVIDAVYETTFRE